MLRSKLLCTSDLENMRRASLVPSASNTTRLASGRVHCERNAAPTTRCLFDPELVNGHLSERLARPKVPLTTDFGRRFLYARYNIDLSREGLDALGFRDVDPKAAQKMDNATPEHIALLERIGTKAGQAQVDKAHFGRFV